MLRNLDFKDTTILKGLAISAIVLHNYFHAVSPVQENEFTVDPTRFRLFVHTIADPAQAIQAWFSFFGHFGVSIFVFLSAYGLAKSYWDDRDHPWGGFVWGRVKKLYPIFGLVILPWIIILSVVAGPVFVLKQIVPEILLMLAGLSTVLPGFGLPPVGPWWFIPFIIQFYVIWPLLRKFTVRFGWRGLVVLSVLCSLIAFSANPFLRHWSMTLLDTPIGRMPSLCFGIIAARYPVRINVPVVLSSLTLVVLGSLYIAIWPLTFLSANIVGLWTYLKLRKFLRKVGFLERIGRYSLVAFLINGIVRIPFIDMAASPQSQLFFGLLSAFVTFLFAAVIHKLLSKAASARHGGCNSLSTELAG